MPFKCLTTVTESGCLSPPPRVGGILILQTNTLTEKISRRPNQNLHLDTSLIPLKAATHSLLTHQPDSHGPDRQLVRALPAS